MPRCVLAALVAVALASLALTRLDAPLAGVILVFVAFEAWRADRGFARMARAAYALQPDGQWLVQRGAGENRARLADFAILGPLVVLRFAYEGRGRDAVVLWPGAVDADALRALRVWLRHGAARGFAG